MPVVPNTVSRVWKVESNIEFGTDRNVGESQVTRLPSAPTALLGCRWDATNYSCAYDSLLVPLFYTLLSIRTSIVPEARWPTLAAVLMTFDRLPAPPSMNALETLWRDPIRTMVQRLSPAHFPTGHTLVSVGELASRLSDTARPSCVTSLRCSECSGSSLVGSPRPLARQSHYENVRTLHQLLSRDPTSSPSIASIRAVPWNLWLASVGLYGFMRRERALLDHFCPLCGARNGFTPIVSVIDGDHTPLLFFETQDFKLEPPSTFSLPCLPSGDSVSTLR